MSTGKPRCMNGRTFLDVRPNGMSSSSKSATTKPHIMEILSIFSMLIDGAYDKSQFAESRVHGDA